MPAPTHVTVSPRSFACDLATICAPTLAGLKPASLFRYQPASGQDGTAMAVAWHALLAPRGVTVRVLKACPVTGAVLVYVYRPTQVAAILQRGDVQDFLQSEGYTPGNAESMLAQLSQRLCCEEDFPHEIGVFLGYPLADVIGFIQNRGKNFTACGYWKDLRPLLLQRHPDPAADCGCLNVDILLDILIVATKGRNDYEQDRSSLLERHRQYRGYG